MFIDYYLKLYVLNNKRLQNVRLEDMFVFNVPFNRTFKHKNNIEVKNVIN